MVSEVMNLSINGQSLVPPGFRFHPTEEELLHYYLRKKVASQKIDLDVIRDIDLNKLEPWDIQEKCKIGSTPQNEWYLFSHRDKKYPTGTRTNRATAAGFWKATGRDKVIFSNFKRIGMRKTLVFYIGRAPQGKKSHWIMHEYRLDDNESTNFTSNNISGDTETEDIGWVVCRVFKKKNHNKLPIQNNTPETSRNHPQLQKDDFFNQILKQYMDKSCFNQEKLNSNSCNTQNLQIARTKKGNEEVNGSNMTQIPGLMESPTVHSLPTFDNNITEDCMLQSPLLDWVALDRFVASQLNGESIINEEFSLSFGRDGADAQLAKMQNADKLNLEAFQEISSTDTNFWSFSLPLSSSDPLRHLFV